MVHVVKGRQCSAYTVLNLVPKGPGYEANTVLCRVPAPQSQKWSLRPTLDLDSDKFRCRNELDNSQTPD